MVTRLGSLLRTSFATRLIHFSVLTLLVACGWGLNLSAQHSVPLRKIGELELAIRGLSATTESRLTVPKNVASGIRVAVRAGANEVSAADATRLLGGPFTLKGELSGPGLAQTLSLPAGAADVDPFLLRLPGLTKAGHYALANLRIVREEIVAGQPVERTVLDVAPSAVDVEVIDEILITSVTTRPLTLDEIRQRGIVLDADDYLGFEFTLAMKLESTPVNVSFPVAFNREGVAVPAYLTPPGVSRTGISMPTIVPMLLEARPTAPRPAAQGIPLTLDGGEEIRIPSVLVIPGNVGYLKQFFSAQLFVANGAPTGTRLSLHDVDRHDRAAGRRRPRGPEPRTIRCRWRETETGVQRDAADPRRRPRRPAGDRRRSRRPRSRRAGPGRVPDPRRPRGLPHHRLRHQRGAGRPADRPGDGHRQGERRRAGPQPVLRHHVHGAGRRPRRRAVQPVRDRHQHRPGHCQRPERVARCGGAQRSAPGRGAAPSSIGTLPQRRCRDAGVQAS